MSVDFDMSSSEPDLLTIKTSRFPLPLMPMIGTKRKIITATKGFIGLGLRCLEGDGLRRSNYWKKKTFVCLSSIQ